MKRHILARAIPSVVNNGHSIKVGARIELLKDFPTQSGKRYPKGSVGIKDGGNRYIHQVRMSDGVTLDVPRTFSFIAR